MGTMGNHPDVLRALHVGRPAAAVCYCPLLLSAAAPRAMCAIHGARKDAPTKAIMHESADRGGVGIIGGHNRHLAHVCNSV